ncbi:MAG: hypothetical protein GX905_02780 [Bacteroidales bacterium]|nr:hypothetical protein [Bacteroidales bacterium]
MGDKSEKRKKILNRILEGQFFNDDYNYKLGLYRAENDKKGEASFQLMYIQKLAHIMAMGGSKTYPIAKVQTMMKEMKKFITTYL